MHALHLLRVGLIAIHAGLAGLMLLRGAILLLLESRQAAYAFVRRTMVWLLALAALECAAYGYIRFVEPNWIVVSHLRVADEGLAQALGGARLVQVTDLHIERVGFRERQLIRQVNRQHADWVAVTGDLINDRRGWPAALAVLHRLKAKHGIYVVPGNTDNAFFSSQEFASELARLGAHALINARAPMGDRGAWLVGVDDPVEKRDDLETALNGLNRKALPPIVLLAHSPDIFAAAREVRLPLALVGHTHGGQVGIDWIRKHSRYADRGPYMSGRFQQGGTVLYVNRGIGWKEEPHRFLAWPEVLVVDFRAPARGAAPAGAGATRELWLSDFETTGEEAVRWRAWHAYAQRTREHAAHGRDSAKVTFNAGGDASSLTLGGEYLSDAARHDWNGYDTLALEIFNAQSATEPLAIQLYDAGQGAYEETVSLPPHALSHVTIPLGALSRSLDPSRISRMTLARKDASHDVILYVDAVRLLRSAAAPLAPPAPAETAAAAASGSLEDAAITPDQIGGWHFEHDLKARWRVIDATTGKPVTRIPLAVVGPEMPLSIGLPIAGGVPFAMGQLVPTAALRLRDMSGARWPIQTKPLALWEDGSVKWLLVTAQVPSSARGRQLWLEYGEPVRPDPPAEPRVRVEESPQAVTVTTGPLRFTVSKQRFALFDSAFVDRNGDGVFADAQRLSRAGDLVLKHGNVEFRSSKDTTSYTLQVEEAGPLRATLKASGWFRDAAGRGFCQFTVRMQAFAGLPQVRLYHTFIYTGYPANLYNPNYKDIRLPDNETIQEISVELPVTISTPASLITADDHGIFSAQLDAPTTMSQLAHDAYQIARDGADVPLRTGVQTAGWVLWQDEHVGVMAGVREAWQQYPKAFEANPRAQRLVIRLWPASAGELNLETGPEAYGPDAVARGSAFGLGKTHELWVGFLGVAIDPPTARALAGLWQEPWLLSAHPSWVQDTDALGTVGPAEPERFPEHEAMLEDLFAWAERQPKAFNWYGMLDYGDTRTWYRKEAYDKSYDDWGWHPEGRWGWHNVEAVGAHGGALMSFLRTQQLPYFRFGEAKARHIMDVDTVHYDTIANDRRLSRALSDEFSKVGSMHRHNAYHWGGRNEEATHTNVAGLLLYYDLTGYDRALDVAKEVGGFMLGDPVTYTRHPDIAPSRAIGNVLWNDVLLLQATGDRRFRKGADQWVKVLLAGQQKDGTWLETYNPLNGSWSGDVKTNYVCYHVLPALIAYQRLSGNADVAAAIVKGTDAMIAREPYLQFFDALAYSFLLTGKGEYVDEGMRRALATYKSQRHDADPMINGTVFEKAIYDRVGPILYTVPYTIGAMDATDFPAIVQSMPKTPPPTPLAPTPAIPSAAPSLPPAADAAGSGAVSYTTLVVPSTEKVFPDDVTPRGAHPNPIHLSLARNEAESAQLALRAEGATLRHVTLETSDLTRTDGAASIPREAITWAPVGFVKTKRPDYDVARVGWWPDPLLDPVPFDVEPSAWRPVWVTVSLPSGIPAGDYAGHLTIRPANGQSRAVALTVHVWDFELPARPALKTAFDVYPSRIESAYQQFFPQWWARWRQRPSTLTQRFYEDLRRHRLAPILNVDASQADGVRTLQWVRDQGLSAVGIGQRGGSFDNNWPKDPAHLQLLEPVYRAYAYHLRDAELLDRHYVYLYDEPAPGDPDVAAVAHMIHRGSPQLKNLVTLNSTPDVAALTRWFDDLDIVCLRNVTADPAAIAALRRMGKEVWLYVSGPTPPYPAFVIDYPALAYRIMPWMCWKYGVTGLLYWSVNFWTTNPYQEPMNTPWQQNGNGSLYYPGPEGPMPSIRLEVLRDGVEDYDYLALLKQHVDRVKASGLAARDSQTQALVAQADQALTIEASLVSSLRDYARDPQALEAQRTTIAELIEKLQRLLAG